MTRSLRILEAVARHQPVTAGELSRIVGVPEGRLRRTVAALVEAGWLRALHSDTTRWEIGARVLGVRPAAQRGASLFPAAREPMVRLRDMLNETVHLSVPDALNEMVVVDRVDCDHPVRTFQALGETSPPHATATGHAILAHLLPPEVGPPVFEGLGEHREESVTATADLLAELRRVKDRGYAVDRNRYRPGVCTVAAPVLDGAGAPLAAVAVSLPDSRFDPGRLDELGRLVKETGARIAARHLG
ncbi:IclR family transcriptional regulator [Streptomyces sp. MB09-02B]|uniref:IclR family transcriptional regulator n=1 Tax=Streptomyces sp. MB09-02B TaxID=3028667 RepID=UPI0029ADF006|nr:IclR family transcriptional regulator [Streptomyces sp. MB09-02B]MDX3640351.1 IclR family transcriptional regulator [Streptomyces sp. MB09-02B]